jgi:conjugative transfer ATPase
MLNIVCDRLCGGLANAGIQARRMVAADVHDWLLRWFNPRPALLGPGAEDRERFYALARYPDSTEDGEDGEIELASGRDFSQRLFFGQPRSDVAQGTWYFDGMPHRVLITDRLRMPPGTGHLTGETRKGDAINTLFDQMPEDTLMCLTMVATPQDVLEADLNHLAKKAVGETLASEQTLKDVQEARSLIGSAHKLYRGTLAFYLRGRDEAELDRRGLDLANVMLNAGLQPVREDDEVAPLNSYLRWLPCCYNPGQDRRKWYTQLMFAQHAANLSPVWGRAQGTGHPGITMFNRGGGPITFDPLNRLDRQMNAHLFLFGPTGSGKSATLNNLLNQVTAIYRPRLFIVEAGNSFGLFSDFARRLGLTVNRVKLAPGSGVSLAPFADARRLIETPSDVQTLDADALDEDLPPDASAMEADEQRDVLGELEITARLMITGGEDKEEARMTRADRSLIRQCILDAAEHCVARSARCSRAMCATRCARGPGPDAARDAARAAAGDGGRDGHVLPRHGRRDVRPRRLAVARGRHHPGRSGDLRPRGLQRAALHRLHQPDQHGEQHRRARPVPGPPDRQRHRRRTHHHQEPIARALRGQDHQDVAQAGRLVLAGHTKHRRSAARRRAHAQHDRVVDLPVDAAG